MKTSTTLLAVLISAVASLALGDTFGSGANTFSIDFAVIGKPGNAPDTTGSPSPVGSVNYDYRIGKYEVSEQTINKANALGGLGITKDVLGAGKPATSISWNEAARFINWLNISTGSAPAYKFAVQPGGIGYDPTSNIELWTINDTGYNPNNLYRNSQARYFLPSVDEWYKAAYYNPTSGIYYDYPTGSNSLPTAVSSGTTAGTVVLGQSIEAGPADITLAGGLSPYSTMGQGGNVFEWEETDQDLANDSSTSIRSMRGGMWYNGLASNASSTFSYGIQPQGEDSTLGFRVAAIPLYGDYNNNNSIDAADYVLWRKDPTAHGGSPAGYNFWRSHLSLPGDYNGNALVDAADYVLWRKGGPLQNEINNPGAVNAADYTAWRQRFGNLSPGSGNSLGSATVPEPATLSLIFVGIATLPTRRRKSVPHNRV